MKLFISGWAGFKEALGDIPEDWHFINPFLDFDEEILNFLQDKSGKIAVGWSTGGHIILKNINFFSERFKKIIVVAGFKKFTNYVNPRLIKRMILKMKTQPEEVINNFLINAGCKPLIPKGVNYKKLIHGLEYLLSSELAFSDVNCVFENLTFIQGMNDKILPIKALEDLKEIYPFAQVYYVEKNHWIGFNEILKIEAPETV